MNSAGWIALLALLFALSLSTVHANSSEELKDFQDLKDQFQLAISKFEISDALVILTNICWGFIEQKGVLGGISAMFSFFQFLYNQYAPFLELAWGLFSRATRMSGQLA